MEIESVSTGLGTKIRVMDFRNPVFRKGLNCTVRFGYKWANLKVGEKLIFTSGQEARVERILVCRFKDLTDKDIKYDHDPHCRSKEGLFNCLSALYPEFARDKEQSVVTVIYFRIL